MKLFNRNPGYLTNPKIVKSFLTNGMTKNTIIGTTMSVIMSVFRAKCHVPIKGCNKPEIINNTG